MCICLHVYMFICLCIYVYIYMCMCTQVFLYMHLFVCVCEIDVCYLIKKLQWIGCIDRWTGRYGLDLFQSALVTGAHLDVEMDDKREILDLLKRQNERHKSGSPLSVVPLTILCPEFSGYRGCTVWMWTSTTHCHHQ